jgi:tetratricopeptide (TPR) repeat protein
VAAVACAARHDAHEIAWKLPVTLWGLFNLRGYGTDWMESVETGLASARHLQDQAAEGWLLNHLAMAYQQSGSSSRAIGCFRQALAIRRALATYRRLGRFEEAMTSARQAVRIIQEVGEGREESGALTQLAPASPCLSQPREAITQASRAAELSQHHGDPRAEAEALTVLGQALQDCGHPALARQHQYDAYLIFSDLGDPRATEILGLTEHNAFVGPLR